MGAPNLSTHLKKQNINEIQILTHNFTAPSDILTSPQTKRENDGKEIVRY